MKTVFMQAQRLFLATAKDLSEIVGCAEDVNAGKLPNEGDIRCAVTSIWGVCDLPDP